MTRLDRLDQAESALTDARANVERLAALRADLESEHDALVERAKYLEGEIGRLRVERALGNDGTNAIEIHRGELRTVEQSRAEVTSALAALSQRQRAAERAVRTAEDELRAAVASVAAPIAARLRDETREAFRKAFALQRLWATVAETASPGAWNGHCHVMHGDEGAPGSIPEIAREEGIALGAATLRPKTPLPPLTIDALRRLAAEYTE